jgi:hypothetical protein
MQKPYLAIIKLDLLTQLIWVIILVNHYSNETLLLVKSDKNKGKSTHYPE